MLAIYVSTLEREYSRSGVFFAADPGEKIFVKLPSQRIKLIRKILELNKLYDPQNVRIVVMSPNHLLAPIFRALTPFQIILDAGWPLSDSTRYVCRKRLQNRQLLNSLIDAISFRAADKVVLESRKQIDFVNTKFRISESKLFSLFTGFNEIEFRIALGNPEMPIECTDMFHQDKQFVFFRGKHNSESGLDVIIAAARLLQINVTFVVVSNINISNCPENVIVINRFVSSNELVWLFFNSTIVLGQISESGRLKKTIPHKLFEAGYFSKCYITPPSPALFELLGKDSFITVSPVNSDGLVESINEGLSNVNLRNRCAGNIHENYLEKSSQPALGFGMREIIELKN